MTKYFLMFFISCGTVYLLLLKQELAHKNTNKSLQSSLLHVSAFDRHLQRATPETCTIQLRVFFVLCELLPLIRTFIRIFEHEIIDHATFVEPHGRICFR
jgi:uncharacterized protein YbgA (DUF1722 family)